MTALEPQPSPLPRQNNPSAFTESNLQAIARRASTLGIHSFVMIAPTAVGEVSCRFQDITPDQALKSLLQGIAQAVEIDSQMHPDRSDSYRQAMKHFVVDIGEAVKKLNQKTSML